MEETLNDILRLASSLISDAQLESNRNNRHFVVGGESVTVLIFPTAKKRTIQSSIDRSNDFIIDSLNVQRSLPWKNDVLDFATSTGFLGHGSLKSVLNVLSSVTIKRILLCGIPKPLTSLLSAVLLLKRDHTERDSAFIRRFIGGLPDDRTLCRLNWSLLSILPRT